MAKKDIVIDENKVEIKKTLVLKGQEWTDLQQKSKAELLKNLKVDGFRKGKVPANIAEKYVSKAQILQNAMSTYLSQKLDSIFEEVKKESDRVIAVRPRVDLEKLDENEAVIELTYPLDTDLSNLKLDSVKVKFDLPKVTDADINEYIEAKLKETALQLPLTEKQKTENGDTVTLNYKGFVDGEEFDGGQAENFDLKLGSKTFIDTFEEQLLDKKIGYKGDVIVTFPKEYPVTKLAGKEATFKVEIVAAKRPEETKLTDENIYVLRAGAAKTLDEAKNVLKWVLLNNKIELSLNTFIEKYVQDVVDKNEIKINDMFVWYQVEQKRNQIISQLKQQNIKFEEYLKVLDKTEQEFNELVFKEEKAGIAFSLVSQKLLKETGISNEVTEEDLTIWGNRTSMPTGLPTSFLTGFFMSDNQNKEQINQRILERKHVSALLAAKDPKAGEKLAKLEKELDENAAKIAEEWNKRAEELKAAKMSETVANAEQKQEDLEKRISKKTKKSSK
ncbi:trigger factor [Mycoplasma zalophidermidis]|uniref:Trigger factor n=1 Tax=Mycoplasma zalophidermidis TaxID=398174 RepID=A0ABS6DRC6_9MOLU|nr:trigger factor [Mycoplasma zalophidermidis]MBU4689623.1 trigger factor [Mycoplasma zalophidermidis]MBU4693521.1 trigger factor [Mycoplasma zalophidermidis]MCR8966519.1 trigger factor [Mycoplasma zalophidermidis]